MQAFILAGGFATRLWPLTEKRAKPLLPLAGKPLVSYLVEQVPKDVPITVSTNNVFRGQFESWKRDNHYDNVEILIEDSGHDDQKLGALGAVRQWVQDAKIEDDVLLMTGDNYCGFSVQDFLASYKEGTALLAAHDIGDLESAKSFGTVLVDSDGKTVIGFEEKPREPKTTLVSTGIIVLPKATLPILIEYAAENPDNVGGIFEELVRRSVPIECFTFTEPWFDVGSFEAYLEATRALVGNNVQLEEGASCKETECSGSIVLGSNTSVTESTLKDVVTFEDCIIEDCHLENCILDRGCRLKGIDLDGKMLREDTELTS